MKRLTSLALIAACSAMVFAETEASVETEKAYGNLLEMAVSPSQLGYSRDDNLAGLSVGWYFPLNREMRDRFGNNFVDLGFSPPFGDTGARGRQTSSAFGIIRASRDGNRLLIIPATFGVLQGSPSGRNSETRPYIAARAGVAYFDYRFTDPMTMTTERGSKFGLTGNIETGVILNRNLRLAAKYNWFQKVDGNDFSGIEVMLAYQFFRL